MATPGTEHFALFEVIYVVAELPPAFRFMQEEDQNRDDVAHFTCGSAPWHVEIADFLRSGEAMKGHRPPKKITFLYCAAGGDGAVIGFANIVAKETPASQTGTAIKRLLLTWFAVSEDHQRLGHGTAMLAALEQNAKDGSFDLIELRVHEHNDGAINLYRKAKFQFLDVPPFDVGNHRYLKMVKNLRSPPSDS